ncbi:cytochrome b/b6 domain-containing protein [Advenella sp. RU8]|uniref:cytochrome b/b6 domain-containing protein n=1 Tax=Advenella sp. RU8 TaxID=3399575 RepID=UPI003AAF92A5
MQTLSSSQANQATTRSTRRVSDAPTRMFHWLFAASFLIAYLTADGEQWRLLHVTSGYTMAGLLVFRIVYGLFGPRQVSLKSLWNKVSNAPQWLRNAISSQSVSGINWRQGQNMLMALAIILLLLMTIPLTLSGYGTYNDWSDFLGGDWLEDLHEFFGEAFLIVVLAHLGLIIGLSFLRRKNQASPMLTGRVEGTGPDLVKNNRGWLAILILVTVLAYGAFEWQQSPNGLVSPVAISSIGEDD